jgi:hypothetical protein
VRSQEQAREVELKFVLVIRRVGAFHVADLALKAAINNLIDLLFCPSAVLGFVPLVRLKKVRERGTEIEAEAASVTDFEGAMQLLF